MNEYYQEFSEIVHAIDEDLKTYVRAAETQQQYGNSLASYWILATLSHASKLDLVSREKVGKLMGRMQRDAFGV